MKWFKIIAWTLLAAFIAIQFFPTHKNVGKDDYSTDVTKVINVPANVAAILKTSCYDCHSNTTQYPWYNNIQPAAWYLEHHVKEGKAELNFNEFGTYSERKKRSKLRSIANQIKDGEMPMTSYTLIHRDAKLTEEEKKAVTTWVYTAIENLDL